VFPCRNSFPALIGKFVCFSESQEKLAEKSGDDQYDLQDDVSPAILLQEKW
jgi:hypothetical protein